MKHFYFSSFDQSLYKGLLSIYLTNHDFPTYNEYVFTTYTYIVNTFRAESINIEKEGTLQWRDDTRIVITFLIILLDDLARVLVISLRKIK